MSIRSIALIGAALALVPAALAEGSVLRSGQTTAQFQEIWNSFFTKPGNHLVTYDAYRAADGMKYVVYGVQEDHPEAMAYAEMDLPAFQETFNQAAAAGFGLIDITVAETPSGALMGGLWEKGAATGALGEQTQGQMNTWQNDAKGAGNVPIDLECYGTNEDPKYAVIWKHDPAAGDWKMEYGLSRSAFQERYNFHVDEGYRMVQVDVCSNNDTPRYGGIFIKTDGRSWFSKGDMSAGDLLKAQTEADDGGYRLLSVAGYLSGKEQRFSAVWSQ